VKSTYSAAYVTASIIWVNNLRKIPIDEHSTLNLRFGPVITIKVTQFVVADDQYVPVADVLMKNATLISGFVSCNVSRLT
jgi:hypothetical protein